LLGGMRRDILASGGRENGRKGAMSREKADYSSISEVYDDARPSDAPHLAWWFAKIAAVGQLGPGKRLIDLGCGTGYHAKLLAEQAAWVVGLDFSMQALGAARKRSLIPVVRADARRLCFAEDVFDIVFCSGLSLFNTDDLEQIRELFVYYQRYLRPGGVILFLSASEFTGRPSKDSDWMNHRWKDLRRFVGGPHLGPFVFHPSIVRILGTASFNLAVTGVLKALNVFLRRRMPFLVIVPDSH